MKLKPGELLLLLLLLSRGRGRARGVSMGNWVPEPGIDPLPVVPLPPNPLEPAD